MKGLSTGDLKVVWGGAEGREIDLARTLPEQGVRPNDVLRVLVEIYEGGVAGSLRRDRVEREWRLLEKLARANPQMLEIVTRRSTPGGDAFEVQLHGSPGVEYVDGDHVGTRTTHPIRLEFTRFYPDVPIECYVDAPLFHPNVKAETGFVCLWEQANPRDTAIQAIARAQAMAAYRMVNMGGAHLMNKPAGEWYEQVAVPRGLVPLTWDELRVYELRDGQMLWLEPGRGLAARPASRLR
jgi:ubiquitin-protein ligase